MRYIPAFLRNLSARMPLLSFLLLFCCAYLTEAAPSVSGFRLSAGSAVRLQKYQNAELSCTIENPDSQEHQISLRMLSQEGVQTGYYTDQIKVPPSSVINYRTLVQAEMSEKYKVEVFCDGKKMSYKGDEIFMKLIPPKASQLLVIDDNGNGLGSFTQQKYFKDRFFVSTISTEKLASIWTALKDFQYVVINAADFSKMRPMQFTALLDYTANGGIIIFSNPEAAAASWNTPLAALLPVIPAGLRKTDSIPEISKILSKFQGFNEKNPPSFLESFESGDGISFLYKDNMPVFRWKKYGFGSARFSAIPLSDESWKSKQDWEEILKLYFSKPDLAVNYRSSEETLDLMTGVSIPSSGLVKTILGAYFLLLFVIAGLGLYLRKAALAWIAAATLSVVCTGMILAGASGRSSDKGKLAASISIETLSPGKGAPKESFFSFYSSKAMQSDLKAENQFDFISTITPMQNSLMAIYAAQDKGKSASRNKDGYGSSMMQTVRKLEVTRDNGTQALKNLSINANDSRQFMMSGRNQDSTQTEFPDLVFSTKGLETNKIPAPASMKAGDSAFISFPSGLCLPLKMNGRVLEIPQAEQAFHDNAVEQALENMIKEAFRKSSPALIVSSKTRKNSLSQDFSTQGIQLSALPLKETYKADQSLTIPAAMIPISAADSSSRMIFEGNRFKKDFPCTGEQNFSLLFSLPSSAIFLEPEEITVRFDYRNNGANINAIPLLYTSSKISEASDIFAVLAKEDKARAASLPKDKKGRKIQPSSSVFGNSMRGKLLCGTETSKGSFKFTGDALKGVIDSLNGNGTVIIAGLERDKTLTEEQKIKANSWTPVKLEVQVKGKLKMPQNSFSY